ncbi:MAG: hypothetical protein RL642_245, partial [Bacteroidota bacterium]
LQFTNFTVEAWIKPASGGSLVQSVISKSNSSANSGFVFPATTNRWSNCSFIIYINGQKRTISAPMSSINSWLHAAATYDGNTMKLYLGGILMNSFQVIGSISNNTDSLLIGTNAAKTQFFKGQLDEVRIWNRALSECEIQQNMGCQLALPQSGLQAYYRFDQGLVNEDNTAITTLADSSLNQNNGNLTGFSLVGAESNWVAGSVEGVCANATAPVIYANAEAKKVEVGSSIRLSVSGASTCNWTGPNGFTSAELNPVIANAQLVNSGVYHVSTTQSGCEAVSSVKIDVAYRGSGLHFAGSTQKVTIAHRAGLNPVNGFTVETWLYPSGSSPRQALMEKGYGTTNNGIEFLGTDDGWFTVSMKIKVNGTVYSLSAPFPGINQWSHVASVFDGTRMLMYVNGTLAAINMQSIVIPQNSNPIILGNNETGTYPFTGILDETRIWNRPLAACEIDTRRGAETTALHDNLLAYYKFNQGLLDLSNADEIELEDATINQYHGVLTGFSLIGSSSNWSTGKYIDNVSASPTFSLAVDNSSVTHAVNYIHRASENCNVISKIIPSGLNPVAGDCTSQVWIESALITHEGNNFVKRHYQLTPSANAASATGTITLYFTQEDFNLYNSNVSNNVYLPTGPTDNSHKATVRIAKFAGSSSNGSGMPSSYAGELIFIDPDDDKIVWNPNASVWEITFDVEGFSGFYLQASLTALPLTWLDFNIKEQHGGALLTWETADELNTNEFTVQHRSAKTKWSTIGKLKAHGINNQKNVYSYFHPYPLVGTNWYRVVQIDHDLSVSYSKTKTLDFKLSNVSVKIMANPVNNKLLKIYLLQPDTISVYSSDGKMLLRQKFNVGIHEVDLNPMPSGFYLLRVQQKAYKVFVQ